MLKQCKNTLKQEPEGLLEIQFYFVGMMMKEHICSNLTLPEHIMVGILSQNITFLEWKAVAVGENYKNAKEFL